MSDQVLPQIVYMLGAGASMQALPMVRDIPGALRQHVSLLDKYTPKSWIHGDLKIAGVEESHRTTLINGYKKLIQSLAVRSDKHESIDTYAKKLFLRSKYDPAFHTELQQLKLGLALFMAFQQAKHGEADSRYDGLLASLLVHDENRGLRLPGEVFILSWNYDQQLALAFTEYVQENQVKGSIEHLGIMPLELLDVKTLQSTQVVHLNGMFCHHTEYNEIIPMLECAGQKEKALVDQTLILFAQHTIKGQKKPGRLLMQFAWEVLAEHVGQLTLLCDRLRYVQELVVIGYSFPFFNRAIDRKILEHMPALKHIYVQAPEGAAQDIIKTIQTMPIPTKCKIEAYTNTDKFLLPPGL